MATTPSKPPLKEHFQQSFNAGATLGCLTQIALTGKVVSVLYTDHVMRNLVEQGYIRRASLALGSARKVWLLEAKGRAYLINAAEVLNKAVGKLAK